MIKIKDWLYFYGVLRKYKIRWSPFAKSGTGSYTVFHNKTPLIHVNPFDKEFLEIALHEVGHHVAKRNGYEVKYSSYEETTHPDEWLMLKGKSYLVTLEEEAFASRFAGKACKRVNRSVLVGYFQTYTSAGYKSKRVDKVWLTDIVPKLIRRIE